MTINNNFVIRCLKNVLYAKVKLQHAYLAKHNASVTFYIYNTQFMQSVSIYTSSDNVIQRNTSCN